MKNESRDLLDKSHHLFHFKLIKQLQYIFLVVRSNQSNGKEMS